MIDHNEYLTSGDFAHIFGIKKDTLFFYDRKGIFSPRYIDDNGYRYYHINQLIEFRTIEILKTSGLSLNEIKEYLDHKSPQQFMKVADTQIKRLKKNQAAIESYIEQLSRTNELLRHALITDYGVPAIVEQSAENYIMFPLHATPEETEKWKVNVAEVLVYCQKHNLMSDFLRGSLLHKENILKQNFTKDTSLIRVNGDVKDEHIITKPAGLYGVIEYRGNYNNIADGYKTLMDFIKKSKCEISGDAYELEYVGYLLTENRDHFVVQISIPISPVTTRTES
jgi:DNA-binding transcriptional MerR regulator